MPCDRFRILSSSRKTRTPRISPANASMSLCAFVSLGVGIDCAAIGVWEIRD
jgi:hypothetical protein